MFFFKVSLCLYLDLFRLEWYEGLDEAALPRKKAEKKAKEKKLCVEDAFAGVLVFDMMSRRAAAGRAELLAEKGASGRMQRPAEQVPIPIWSMKAP